MSSTDFIPRPDAEFNLWQASLVSIVQAAVATWGILPADLAALILLQTAWAAAFNKASNKQNRTAADVQAKDDARAAYEKALRQFVAQWLASNAKVPNSERERMGLTVKTSTRTAVSVPSTAPVGTVDFHTRLQHSIAYADEATPSTKAKPAGVHGCEVWVKLGDATDFAFLATNTASPYLAVYVDGDAGKTATYRLRWVNTRGEQGPWSGTFGAIIVG
jgi:hypothetical protein